MSTATVETFKSFWVPGVDLRPTQFSKMANGTGSVDGLKVFKVGTFKDSMGVQRTWEAEHLLSMISHFDILKERNLLTRVPLRDGHPSLFGSGGTVIGEVTKLYKEGDFLQADLKFTEPDALAKYERGTFGPRSLEIGMYETNNGTEFWPTVMGLAFVDISAVEGLMNHQANTSDSRVHYFQTLIDKETIPVPQTEQDKAAADKAAADKAAADKAAADKAAADKAAADKAAADAAGQPPPGSTVDHSASGVVSFKINGQVVTDPALIQRHIENLETVIVEGGQTAREEFVKKLAGANIIKAPDVDDYVAYAKSLNDEQFAAWKKLQEKAAPDSLFANHGAQGDEPQHPGDKPTFDVNNPLYPSRVSTFANKQDEIDVCKQRLVMHKRAGMTEEQMKNTESYKRLAELQAQS
jgi:hypothetical protein